MKAITTKYHGCTDTRGSRISATDGDNRVSIPYPHELNTEEAHKLAAQTLCKKLGWDYQFITGGTKEGYVHVFVPSAIVDALRKAQNTFDEIANRMGAQTQGTECDTREARHAIQDALALFR
jgi:hypothetical protein